ncbi:MAG: Bug family tripartite tricarboxylate transporter substrate binding protein [Burkholderiales bacterium]
MKLPAWFLAAALVAPYAVLAQSYPIKPVHIIVPFVPGGSVDAIARLLGGKMGEALGQAFVIENRPGADATIGANVVAKSAPDGYTLLLIPTNLAIYPALYRKLPFDAQKDFVAVTKVVTTQMVLVANPKLPANSVAELIKLAHAKPGSLNFGGSGPASILQMTMQLLQSATAMDIQAIPYKGDGPVITALIAGEVHLAVLPFAASVPHIKAGRIRILGVTTIRRSPSLPDVPTIAEGGVSGFNASSWQGLFAAAGTSLDTTVKIQQSVATALKLPEVRSRIPVGQDPAGNSPEEFDAEFRGDIAKFIKLAREAKLPPQD